jgi:amino acid adenylation domain-containing protein
MSEAVSSKATAVDYDPFAATAVARVVPTTEAQRELWLADKLGREASLAFNESIALSIEGELVVEALQQSLRELSNRHEALRSVLSEDGMSLFIAPEGTLQASIVDIVAANSASQDETLARLRIELVETQFDLLNGPLVNAVLVKLGVTKYELFITGHHIVCDGWSFGVLARELMALYQAIHTGIGPRALPTANSFGDFALSLLDTEHSQAAEADSRYWVSRFDSSVPVLDLPSDRVRPARRTFNSRREELVVEPSLLDAIRKIGARNGASLHASLFSMYAALIARLGSTDEVVVGVPAAAQAAEGAESLVGHGVNLLPVRIGVDVEEDFVSFLKRARGTVLDAYDHQSSTFGSVLQKLKLDRDPSRLPLVAVQFNLDSAITPESLSLSGLRVSLRSLPRHFENFELFLNASQVDGGLVLECQYNSDLFDASTVRRWLSLYRLAMQRAAANSAAPLAELFAPTPEDLESIARLNDTTTAYAAEIRIEAVVARQALATPDAIAVVSGNSRLTYRELDERANALASTLRARGVGRGGLVGLYCGRSEAMVVGLLGILKSGAGYIPLDPSFPADRLEFMVSDSGLQHIVTDAALNKDSVWKFAGIDRVDIDSTRTAAAPSVVASSADVAYVLYTSGSTGKPKGVQVEHRNVVNFLESMRREPGLAANDVLLAVTTLSFDIAGLEIWLPLTVGARVVIATREDALDGQRLVGLIESERVSMLQATPATWRLLLETGWKGSTALKALCGGEALPRDLAQLLVGRVGELWNMYGPTETTIWSTLQRIRDTSAIISIGHPIANTQVYAVDARMRVLPVGVVGELLIAGEGVTRGYLARPELTAEKFLTDPHAAAIGGRWYRTGDLGRLRVDGTIECLGRVDHQIKLRGYRIELGEIETCLAQHASVDRAVVITREDQPGDVRLVAYLVPRGTLPAAAELRDYLRRVLPEYMIPQAMVELPAIPLLPNGKINRKALAKPVLDAATAGRERVAASTPLEQQILEAMEQVLNLPGLGVTDNFFALGGHSLLAARLAARLNKELGVNLQLRTVFESATASQLAAAVDAARVAGVPKRKPITTRSNQARAALTVMQERIRFVEQMFPGRVTYNTPSAHRLTGALDVAAFERAFNEVVRRQPSLRTFISSDKGVWGQQVLPELKISIAYEDLSAIADHDREAQMMQRLRKMIDAPMDIYGAPLFRTALFKMADNSHIFFFMPHHIIWDGWSFDLMYQEMAAAYPAALQSKPSPLAPLPISYGDYAEWHNDWLKGDEFHAQLAFWKKRFTGLEIPRALPTDHPRRPGMTGEGQVEWVRIDRKLTEGLHAIAKRSDSTINMLAMALYSAMLADLVGGKSVVVGMPVRGRLAGDVEQVMGFFNNLLPIHLVVDSALPLVDWVRSVKGVLLESFANQDVPFERLAGEPEFVAYSQKAGFYQGLFSFQDARERQHDWGGLLQENLPVMQGGATEDFGLWLMESATGLTGGINFNADLFTRETAQMFRARFLALLRDAVARPQATLAELLTQPGEERRVFEAWLAAHREKAAQPAVPARVEMTSGDKSATEMALAQIWSGLLGVGVGQIAPTDNFFDLGGSSLLAMQAVSEMESKLGAKIDPRRYVYESLRQLAGAEANVSPIHGNSADYDGLARIWAELLGLDAEQIVPSDNFFDLGGSSLLAMRAVTEGEARLGLKIDPRRYVYESLRQLAAPAEASGTSPAGAPVKPEAPAKSKLFGLFGRGKS